MRRIRRGKPPAFYVGLLCLLLSLLSTGGLWWRSRELPPPVLPTPSSVTVGAGAGRRAPGLLLESSHAVLFDPATGEVLYAKGAKERVYPASLTKVMTVLVALEGILNLDEPLTLSYEDYVGLYEQNASMAGFAMGETVTARDLLYAALLPSGAEAARALARAGSGSVEEAIFRMNQKATELGMADTHFANVTGLHEEEHYTTVSDFALLWQAAIQNDALIEAAGALRYTATATEQHPAGLSLVSTLVPRLGQLDRESPLPIIGGKTGYTEEAGLCLVSLARQGGVSRALVTVGAPGDGQSLPYHLLDAYNLYDRCLPKDAA